MDIYHKLLEVGCKMDSHESDLYVESTPASEQLTAGDPNRTHFVDSIDKKLWIELPFSYLWWEAR